MRQAVHTTTRACVTAVIAALAIALAPDRLNAQRNDQRESPEVRDIDFIGIREVSERDLALSIATTESQCKSLLLLPFCWVSRSPTFVDKKYLDRSEFRRDVLRILVFYWKRGYREATVDTAITRVDEGAVRVTFDINEGPPTLVTSLRIEYDSTLLSDRSIRRNSVLRAGDPLNLVVLDTMRVHLQLEMWNRGYTDAEVDTAITVDAERRSAAVLLRLRPGRPTTVGSITVRGNEEVDVHTIEDAILLRKGRLFRYQDLIESQRNLYESNLFSLALFTVPETPDSAKNVVIDVRETKMQEARVAGGFNNIDFIQTDVRYTNYNTFGGARRLDAVGALGNLGASSLQGRGIFRRPASAPLLFEEDAFSRPTWQVSADVKQPAWLRRPENALSLGGFAHRRAAPAVYIDRGYGGQLAFTRSLAPRASASSAYRFEITRVEASDVYFCVNYGVCDNPTVESLRLHQRLNPLQLSASIDRSDIPFSPTKGYIARVDLEHASGVTLSDYRYNRAFAEASAYTHFRYPSRDPRAQVLAAHVRVGFVRPLASAHTGIELLHPRKRFYAGGSNSVRGYGENQLGPRILTIPPSQLSGCDTTSEATIRLCDPNSGGLTERDFTPRPVGGTALLEGSVEMRVPFARKMEWAAFVDAGIVGASRLQNLQDIRNIVRGSGAITPGVGFRYRSPVGPIRIDLGYNPRLTEQLTVVTTARDSLGLAKLVPLEQPRSFTSGGTATGFWALFNRVVLHLSIGQAY